MTPEERGQRTVAELSWQFDNLSKHVDERFARLERQIEQGVGRLEATVAALAYVSRDVYLADKVTFEQSQAAQDLRIAAGNRLAMTSLTLVVTLTLGAGFTLLARLVSA